VAVRHEQGKAKNMVKVIAQKVGFYGGKVREIGEAFEVANEDWADEDKRPKWVELVEGQEETPDKTPRQKRAKKTVVEDENQAAVPPDAPSGAPIDESAPDNG